MARWWYVRGAAVALSVAVLCLAVLAADDGWRYAADLLGGVWFGASILWLWQQGGRREREDEPEQPFRRIASFPLSQGKPHE